MCSAHFRINPESFAVDKLHESKHTCKGKGKQKQRCNGEVRKVSLQEINGAKTIAEELEYFKTIVLI